MRRFSLLLPALLIVIGGGCMPSHGPHDPAEATDPHAGHHAPSSSLKGSVPAGNRVAVVTDLADMTQSRQVRFRLLAEDGRELGPDDLQVAHEKLVHLLVVRDDYREFHHAHPAFLEGVWNAYVPFESGGTYQAYVDIVPADGEPVTLRQELKVGDGRVRTFPLIPTAINTAGPFEGEVAVSEEADGLLYAFSLRKGGAPVAQIDPYLGAYGHVVMLRQGDPDGFVHMHPVTDQAPADGIVRFRSDRLPPGTYAIFGQFVPEGDERVFPFVLRVGG